MALIISSSSGAVVIKVVMMMICLVMISAPYAEAAISCATVVSSISSCLGYLRGDSPVSTSCCDGVKSLNNAASTTPDVQAACQCIKTLAPNVGANPTLVNSLPRICHVNIPYTYSPSLDCSKITR